MTNNYADQVTQFTRPFMTSYNSSRLSSLKKYVVDLFRTFQECHTTSKSSSFFFPKFTKKSLSYTRLMQNLALGKCMFVCMYVFISEHFGFLVWYTNCGYNVRKIFMQRRKILYIFIECNNSWDWLGTYFFHIGAG
jgi:hypothetical protein